MRGQRLSGRGVWAGLAVLVGAVLSSRGAGEEPLFLKGRSFPLSQNGRRLLATDLDGDGAADLAVALLGRPALAIFRAARDPAVLLEPPFYPAVGNSPVDIAAGDLDGDARADLFVVNSGSGDISVLLGDGQGGFHPQRRVGLSAGSQPVAAQLADFDADGDLDGAVNDLFSGAVSLLFGDGRGGFEPGRSLPVGDNAHALAAADFDGDGGGDLVVLHSWNGTMGTLSFFRGNGDPDRGFFEDAVETSLGPEQIPRFAAQGDFDEDGLFDLGILTDPGNALLYATRPAPGPFDGTFEVREVSAGAASSVDRDFRFLRAADYDLDGHLDLVLPVHRGDWGVHVHRGRGDGTFELSGDLILEGPLRDVAFTRLDGDDIPDAVLAGGDPGSPEIVVIPAREAGAYETRRVLGLEASPRDFLAPDLDGDGWPDLVALTRSALAVFPGPAGSGPAAPLTRSLPGAVLQDAEAADFDGDGRIEIALGDFAASGVLVAFFEGSAVDRVVAESVALSPARLAAADFDGDGRADLAVADVSQPLLQILFAPGTEDASRPERKSLDAGGRVRALLAADLDGDGRADLAAALGDRVVVFAGDGGGGFPRTTELLDLPDPAALAAADLDRDGRPELLLALRRELVVASDPTGPARRFSLEVGQDIRRLGVEDLDGDGALDVAVAVTDRVLFYRRPPGGAVEAPERYYTGRNPVGIAFGDLDADGRLDAAVAASDARAISILRGLGTRSLELFRRGEADGDQVVAPGDALAILIRLFRGGAPLLCPDAADTDDDGLLVLTDAVFLLSHLFRGGAPPPAPGPGACGADPTADELRPCERPCR